MAERVVKETTRRRAAALAGARRLSVEASSMFSMSSFKITTSRMLAWCPRITYLVLASACSPSPPLDGTAEPTTERVAVEPYAPTSPATEEAPYLGVVLARKSVRVSTEIAGRLASVDVEVGDRVERGQRIAALDTEELEQELDRVSAAKRVVEAQLHRDQVELDRVRDQLTRRESMKNLFAAEEVAAARTQVEVASAALEGTRASLNQEEIRLEQVQGRLAHSVLRAPISGIVSQRYLDAGALAPSGTPVARLISSQDFLLRFAAPPNEATAMHVGQPVEIRLAAIGLTLGGAISRLSPAVDPASQMIFVDADLNISTAMADRLKDGLVARVVLNAAPSPAKRLSGQKTG